MWRLGAYDTFVIIKNINHLFHLFLRSKQKIQLQKCISLTTLKSKPLCGLVANIKLRTKKMFSSSWCHQVSINYNINLTLTIKTKPQCLFVTNTFLVSLRNTFHLGNKRLLKQLFPTTSLCTNCRKLTFPHIFCNSTLCWKYFTSLGNVQYSS